jgi:type I restriction enzyme S subunit
MSVPELRFNEFDESWSQVILDDLAEVERGKFSVRPRNDPRYFGGKMPFVQTGDVTGSDVYLKGFSQTLNEDGIKVSKVFPEDTILITIAANIGDTTITQYPVACPDSVVAIQPKKELTNTIFLKNVIDLQKDFLDSQATQNAQKNINLQVLKPLELIVPSLKEQTKIASLLSSVDEKISQLTQKHELLSQYKQGMMQKLFSRQIHFKADDGSEFGEWEATTLGQTGKFIGGGTPSKENSEFWEGSIPWISSSDLTEESIFKINITRFISQNALNQSATKLVPANSILIVSRVGVGKVAITPNEICTSQDFTSLTLHKGSSIFFAYLIKSLTPYLLEMNQGTSIKGFVKDDLANLELKIPCLEEQTKIANFLSIIDQKIYVVAQQIEQGKQWKKGLLQQMFV